MAGAVTLAALLQARTAGLLELEIWSLLCQAAQALQDLFLAKKACENVPRVSPTSLRLTSRGRVTLLPDPAPSVPWPATADAGDRYLAPEYGGRFRNTSEVDIEKMWIFSLGQSLKEAVNTNGGKLTQPLDNLLTVMTRADPRQRATLMDVLNVISDFCKVRMDCKPFSHVAMDLYREVHGGSSQATPCLSNTANSTSTNNTNEMVTNKPKPAVGKSCSLKDLRPPRRIGLRRAPSHLYGVADTSSARYACPNTCIGPEFVIRASDPSKVVHFYGKKTSHTRKVTVVLLDGQRLNVYCDPNKVTAGQLFEVVAQVERVEENFFLGLTVLLDGDLFFLCPDTRLCKVTTRAGNKVLQVCSLTLYLRVKFFLPSLRGVCKWASKHLLYLQLRRCLLEQQIRCEASEHVVLGGLALQAEFGDYDAERHGDGEYFLLEHYVPEGLLEESLGPSLRAQHRRRHGLDPGRAEEMFVALAQSLDAYGLHFYAVTRIRKNDTRSDMWLAVGGRGILLYDKRGDNRELHKLYVWKNIEKLCYTKQYFILYPRCDVKGIIPIKYKFQLDQNKCLFVFYLASQHHQFFLKLRIELSSLHSLSSEFGVSLTNLGKKNRKLFYVENHRPPDTPLGNTVRGLVPNPKHRSQTSVSAGTSCLDTSINIEEHQNKENEQPGFSRLITDLVIKNNSLNNKEQHMQCLPYFLQYPGGPDNVRRTNSNMSSFPRRQRVKMGTRAISGVPKELSASQDTHASLSSTYSSPPEAYILKSDTHSLCLSPPEAYILKSDTRSLCLSPPEAYTLKSDTCSLCSSPPEAYSLKSDTHSLCLSPPEAYTLKSDTRSLCLSPLEAYTLKSDTRSLCLSPPEAYTLKSDTRSLCSSPEAYTLKSDTRSLCSSPPEAYVLNSSIKSTDETFHLDVNESLSESLVNKFDKLSFSNERILKALKFKRDGDGSLGIQITEGSDGGVYIQSANMSAADVSLRLGDQLIAVDGHSLLRMKYREALDFLQTRGTELDVVVSRAFHGDRRSSPGDSRTVASTVNGSSRGWVSPAPRTPNGIRAVCCVLPDE